MGANKLGDAVAIDSSPFSNNATFAPLRSGDEELCAAFDRLACQSSGCNNGINANAAVAGCGLLAHCLGPKTSKKEKQSVGSEKRLRKGKLNR